MEFIALVKLLYVALATLFLNNIIKAYFFYDGSLRPKFIGLNLSSSIYVMTLLTMIHWNLSPKSLILCSHLLFASAIFIYIYYTLTVGSYINANKKVIKVVKTIYTLCLIPLAVSALYLLDKPTSPLLDFSTPTAAPFYQAIGIGNELNLLGNIIIGIAVMTNIFVISYFLYKLKSSVKYAFWLRLGLIASIMAILNDCLYPVTSFKYYFPLLALVNFVEIIAISIYLNRQKDKKIINLDKEVKEKQSIIVRNQALADLGEISVESFHEISNCATKTLLHLNSAKRKVNKGISDKDLLLTPIDTAIDATNAMVGVFTNYRSIIQGSKNDALDEVDLADTLSKCLKIASEDLKDIKVETDINDVSKIKINKIELKQVLINLLINSAHAIEKSELKKISLSLLEHEDQIYIKVRDNGLRSNIKEPKKIFDRYYTTKKHGTGIGLWTCKKIINSYDGKLYLSDHINTEFVISLPKN